MTIQFSTNDLESQWMPFTANKDFKANPRLLVKADGMYYESHEGGRILDGSAGLFCVAAGHGRKEIRDAIYAALEQLDYAPPFQMGHPLSFEAARKVARILPDHMNHVFFTNSGSESVDTALKIALAYHYARNDKQRTRFVGRQRAYHGMNFGGLSVGGMVKNREVFGPGLPGVLHMRHTWSKDDRFVDGQPETGADKAEDLQGFVDTFGAETIACCIVEPVAGSTGCLPPPKGYLKRLREICDANGILLIFDEVITGFGRLGTPFADEKFGVKADIVTLAKALSNGTVAMGGVAVSDEVYETIVSSAGPTAVEFFHGYTYSGSVPAAAACCAAMDIYENEGLFENAARLSGAFSEMAHSMKEFDVVTDIRSIGLLAGIDLATDGKPGKRGYDVMKALYANGLLIKLTGDCALLSPPLICEEKHIDEIGTILRKTLKAI